MARAWEGGADRREHERCQWEDLSALSRSLSIPLTVASASGRGRGRGTHLPLGPGIAIRYGGWVDHRRRGLVWLVFFNER